MSKLIQKVKWNLDGSQTEMYMYGEANFEANKAMQEPLEKLYQYENQPDMRDKIIEYIGELNAEYNRCIDETERILSSIGDYDEKPMPSNYIELVERAKTINDIVNDLKGRLEERVWK